MHKKLIVFKTNMTKNIRLSILFLLLFYFINYKILFSKYEMFLTLFKNMNSKYNFLATCHNKCTTSSYFLNAT